MVLYSFSVLHHQSEAATLCGSSTNWVFPPAVPVFPPCSLTFDLNTHRLAKLNCYFLFLRAHILQPACYNLQKHSPTFSRGQKVIVFSEDSISQVTISTANKPSKLHDCVWGVGAVHINHQYRWEPACKWAFNELSHHAPLWHLNAVIKIFCPGRWGLIDFTEMHALCIANIS